MESFSILNIPKYKKNWLTKLKPTMQLDYKRFNIKDLSILEQVLWAELMSIACPREWKEVTNFTNSNVAYDNDIALLRVDTWNVKKEESKIDVKEWEKWRKRIFSPRWVAHQLIGTAVGIWVIPFALIEKYWKWQWLRWSVARIDFYGAFFLFADDLPARYRRIYAKLQELTRTEPSKISVTRVDVAIDFKWYPFPQQCHLWVKPCKNSKRDVDVRMHEQKINSVSYLSTKNSWYWIRIYNKTLQVNKDSKKVNWYGGKWKVPEDWTRFEFEFYPPYSKLDELDLLKKVKERMFWTDSIELWLPVRPTIEFNVENAYNFMMRYAKNHWITMEMLLESCYDYHVQMEEKKEYYWLIDE